MELEVKIKYLLVAGMFLTASAFAQTNSQNVAVQPSGTLIFRMNVISRDVTAVSYEHRSGSTRINFAGTELMPSANGEAKVKSERGSIKIWAEFGNLQSPKSFGNEYLTYILWAISPEGRSVNLGEVLVGDDGRSKVEVTTDLQAFAMIVTAEPYYAVRQPSDVIVLQNIIRQDTKGTIESVNASYTLIGRGGYIPSGYNFDPVILNAKLPLEFFEARNALRIAHSEGADTYASDSYQHAVQLMNTADQYASSAHIERKQLIAVAREEVQTAEDSRAIAVKKMNEQRLAAEQQASADAQARSQGQADNAIRQKNQAESDAATARNQASNAEAATAQANAALADSQAAAATALSAAQADAEASRLAAQKNAQQAEVDKAALRAKLSIQLNSILETRDSARGLIVSMSDVLFDTGKYSLKSGAREKLAKVAGILLAYPGLNIAVGGYTDNVGADGMNQTLSENRAGSVRDYLVNQGVATASVTATGFGNTSPVASNENSTGRQQNRRVELLVSGDAIGDSANVTTGSLR